MFFICVSKFETGEKTKLKLIALLYQRLNNYSWQNIFLLYFIPLQKLYPLVYFVRLKSPVAERNIKKFVCIINKINMFRLHELVES